MDSVIDKLKTFDDVDNSIELTKFDSKYLPPSSMTMFLKNRNETLNLLISDYKNKYKHPSLDL